MYIDLNLYSLKWCSLNNCNWCVSLDIAYILALTLNVRTRAGTNTPSDEYDSCCEYRVANTNIMYSRIQFFSELN